MVNLDKTADGELSERFKDEHFGEFKKGTKVWRFSEDTDDKNSLEIPVLLEYWGGKVTFFIPRSKVYFYQ